MAHLTVVDGPQEGTVYELAEVCHLGRALDCQVQIQDLSVSRRHARIAPIAGRWEIEDLGSGNGTFVNEQQVTRAPLRHGDVIRIALLHLRFEDEHGARPERDLVKMVGGPPELSPKILNTLDAQRPMFEGALAGDVESLGELRRMAERLQTVYAVSEAISSILDVEELLPAILDRLFEVWPAAERAFVMLVDEQRRQLVPKAVKRRNAKDSAEIAVSRTILTEVTGRQHAVLSRDAMADSRFFSGESVANFGIRSMMAAPLVWRGETLGVVYLDSHSLGSFRKPDLELLTGIAGQAAVALGNARLHGELVKRNRLEQDLALAERIQQSFLPRRIPQVPGYAFSARYDPAYEVGGDFYDFIELPQQRIGLVVGDVAGKGVSAALYMARLTRDLRFSALAEPDPGRVLQRMNVAVGEAGHDDIFVTLLYAVLDLRSARFYFANAGHMPPIVRSLGEHAVTVLDETAGLPLGVLPDTEYQTQPHQLVGGDALVLYTDGLVEAMNPARQMFGMERAVRAVGRGASGVDRVMERLVADMRSHVANAPQFDDTTIVCVGVDP
jgi:serine phosphatase RsbU (regulator of sigma subunit)